MGRAIEGWNKKIFTKCNIYSLMKGELFCGVFIFCLLCNFSLRFLLVNHLSSYMCLYLVNMSDGHSF
jgi:hypothetical protein